MIQEICVFESEVGIRALALSKNKIWFAGKRSLVGSLDFKSNRIKKINIKYKDKDLEFRSLAQNNNFIFVLSIENPALLYKINKKTFTHSLVYQEHHKDVFYDSMQFKNESQGMALGDPTESGFSLLRTSDGGNTWQKLSDTLLPKLEQGEAAFAASNTNLVIKNSRVYLVSGGVKSRIFCSENWGESWKVYETPIIQGSTMTGIYSVDFYDELTGIVVGGSYDDPKKSTMNKAITYDGGKSWKVLSNNSGFGYASCVQFVPNSKGLQMVTVGLTGVFFSKDAGETWQQISNDTSYYTLRFLNNKEAYLAGKNKISKLTL